jgi:hypothetical protein
MKVIYNNLIPFKGYKAINIFGLVFVRKGAKFTEVDYNHVLRWIITMNIYIQSKWLRCYGYFSTFGMESST